MQDRIGSFAGSLAWVPDARTNVTATLDYTNNRYRTAMGIERRHFLRAATAALVASPWLERAGQGQ